MTNPRLIVLTGPLEGQVFNLTAAETTLGRESSNHIHLTDLSASRRHCVLRRVDDSFELCDLDSFNGTSVNNLPIKTRRLEDGDRITIGNSHLLFLLHDAPPAAAVSESSAVELGEGRELTQQTIQLRHEDVLLLQPEKLQAALAPQARVARDLNALLKISRAVGLINSVSELQRQLLELIFEVTPAERGAILLLAEPSAPINSEIASSFGWDRQTGAQTTVRVSRAVINQVLRNGAALLANNVWEDEAWGGSESLMAAQTRSLLAVPLQLMERTLGVLYLSASDAATRFDEEHLQLVTASASIAAVALENAQRLEWFASENQRLHDELNIERNMIGEGARMHDVYQFIAKVAPTDATVLIRGESGTGKELAARALHLNSPRQSKPFVAINCAALTETLLESELFGHEKGAFTGAIAQKKGKLEVADGGTIFLDELGEMSPLLQVKLLRVLQEQEFERVGGTRPIKVDVRLIAATNRDLKAAIKDGSFRQDLYYRLNVVSLRLPPLRERREDVPLLTNYFITKYAQKCKRQVRGITPAARALLLGYDWPGNVRELENAIERAVVLGGSDMLQVEDLPEALHEVESDAPTNAPSAKYHETLKETKKQLIRQAVAQADGNITEAARLLGVQANYLHRLIRNLNLKPMLKS
jgi:Nif-specific regulatory protein